MTRDEAIALAHKHGLLHKDGLITADNAIIAAILEAGRRMMPRVEPMTERERQCHDEGYAAGRRSMQEEAHNTIVREQAAFIEWQHGRGAEAGMQWIANGLSGLGLLPRAYEPYGKEARVFYDANKSNPARRAA